MKYYKILGVFLSLSILFSCSNFDEINNNPNATNKVAPGMLATGLLIGMTKQNYEYGSFIDHNFMSKHAITAELIRSELYNKILRSGFDSFLDITNANRMVASAAPEIRTPYEALACFIKAYKCFYLSLTFGDIPYSEAVNPETIIYTPKYDTQKEVMQAILKNLDKAAELFGKSQSFEGDPIFNGDPAKWEKVVNGFKLKVLINLYMHDTEADLNIQSQFSELVNSRSLMESNDDNFQLVYSNKGGQVYPFNDLQARSNGYCVLSSNLVDSLKVLKDNRLFYFAEPSEYTLGQGLASGDFDAYISIDPSLPFSDITKLYGDGKCCKLNLRYQDINNPAGEPIMRIGYAEQCFNIAEGIIRGWMPGNAKEFYERGVRAAMLFVKDHTPDMYVEGRPAITDEYITDYLSNGRAAFASDVDTQLKQIFQQKYFIYFLQNPWDGYYEYRRVLYPVLPIDPKTNMNDVPNQLPKRWMYPQREYDENGENLKIALERQYNGKDTNNDLMWILKK